MYRVLDISRYVINYGISKNYGISNLKLQKLLYFIQGIFLSEEGEPCFEENLVAWDFGPVVEKVYHEYKRFGSLEIPEIKNYINTKNGIWNFSIEEFNENIIKESHRIKINGIVDYFAKFSANQLVEMTHKQDPWKKQYIKGVNRVISKEVLKEFFGGRKK